MHLLGDPTRHACLLLQSLPCLLLVGLDPVRIFLHVLQRLQSRRRLLIIRCNRHPSNTLPTNAVAWLPQHAAACLNPPVRKRLPILRIPTDTPAAHCEIPEVAVELLQNAFVNPGVAPYRVWLRVSVLGEANMVGYRHNAVGLLIQRRCRTKASRASKGSYSWCSNSTPPMGIHSVSSVVRRFLGLRRPLEHHRSIPISPSPPFLIGQLTSIRHLVSLLLSKPCYGSDQLFHTTLIDRFFDHTVLFKVGSHDCAVSFSKQFRYVSTR